jgi:hypothetical protein
MKEAARAAVAGAPGRIYACTKSQSAAPKVGPKAGIWCKGGSMNAAIHDVDSGAEIRLSYGCMCTAAHTERSETRRGCSPRYRESHEVVGGNMR